MEAEPASGMQRRLHYVGTREWIVVRIDHFLIEAAWFGSSYVAAHFADHILV